METAQKSPKWIIIYLWITVILTFIFSLMAYLKPEVQFGDWTVFGTAGALSLAGPLGLYAARNLAIGITSAYAGMNRSVNVLMIAFILRVATDGIDFIHNLIAGNVPIAAFAFVMFAIEAVACIKLSKIK